MKQAAHLLSWVFLPLFMPIYALLVVMYIPSNQDFLFNDDSLYFLPDEAKYAVLYMFFVFGLLSPALAIIVLRRFNVITTIDMENQRERNIPMFIMLTFCLILYFLFIWKASGNILPKYVYALPLSGVFVTASFTYINRWIKISLHAGGAGILTGFVCAYATAQMEFHYWIIILAILASGLTMSARLYLKKHTPIEIYSGWTLATLLTFLINFLYPIG
jgi:hypothetical protein